MFSTFSIAAAGFVTAVQPIWQPCKVDQFSDQTETIDQDCNAFVEGCFKKGFEVEP